MKIAIIGSRSLSNIDLSNYIPEYATEIVSGGAKGIDTLAEEYSKQNNLKLTVFLPEYEKYSRCAPIKRNDKIIEYSDEVIAFWDGKSKGTDYIIKKCKKINKNITIINK